MNNKLKVIGLSLGILLLVFVVYLLADLTLTTTSTFYASNDFCDELGYDSLTLDGSYLPYRNEDYGQVKCIAFYADKHQVTHFDVRRNWRGKLIEVQDE